MQDRHLCRSQVLAALGATALLASIAVAQDGTALLQQSGIKGGLVVHVGCGDGTLTAQLRAGEQYVVQGLDTDPGKVAAGRKRLLAKGQYGPVTLDRFDGRRLPY
ncbi:MAG: hypothetical protein COW34_04355, partial [Armatimonadetes bacterium CG17_big_fil_post_rev_8_21_14_2_50_66_6]